MLIKVYTFICKVCTRGCTADGAIIYIYDKFFLHRAPSARGGLLKTYRNNEGIVSDLRRSDWIQISFVSLIRIWIHIQNADRIHVVITKITDPGMFLKKIC